MRRGPSEPRTPRGPWDAARAQRSAHGRARTLPRATCAPHLGETPALPARSMPASERSKADTQHVRLNFEVFGSTAKLGKCPQETMTKQLPDNCSRVAEQIYHVRAQSPCQWCRQATL